MRPQLEHLCRGQSLSREESRRLFSDIVRGHVPAVQLAALLVALKAKGEQSDEIAGAVAALRGNALAFPRPDYPIADCCGTGGDAAGTLNISTAVALLVAECGLPIVKHGNRSVSSKSGSADVLEHLGLNLDASPATSRRMLDATGFCFLFAPKYHSGIRHAMPVRKELGMRTLFNLVGPLSNPAMPDIQLLGVYDAALCITLAHALQQLGCKRALVVNGGIDELALHASTQVARLSDGGIDTFQLQPEDAGLQRQPLATLAGGDVAFNAAALKRLLQGEDNGAYHDAVIFNAGALLWISGKTDQLCDGVALASAALASGNVFARLQHAVELSNEN